MIHDGMNTLVWLFGALNTIMFFAYQLCILSISRYTYFTFKRGISLILENGMCMIFEETLCVCATFLATWIELLILHGTVVVLRLLLEAYWSTLSFANRKETCLFPFEFRLRLIRYTQVQGEVRKLQFSCK